MQLSNAPGKIVLPFANGGGKNTIPTASQIGITAGAASLTDGFPPLTRTPVAAGGVPPSGLDMNGILYEISAAIRWATAGAGYLFDSTFSADGNVGGYPKGSRVLRSDGAGYWLSTTDNNTTDPEAAGAAAAGWVPDLTNGVAAVTMTNANVTLTPLQYGKPVIVLSGLLTGNLNLIFPNIVGEWTVVNNCTGAFVVTCKTAAGTGVVVTPGRSRIIYGDAVNIGAAVNEVETATQYDNTTKIANTAAINRAGLHFQSGTGAAITTNTSLTAASGGHWFEVQAAGLTVTLPPASGNNAGLESYTIKANFDFTLKGSGTDNISSGAGSANTYAVLKGETITVVANGPGSAWFVVIDGFGSGSFAKSLGSNVAYQTLPGGLIMQIGTIVQSVTSGVPATSALNVAYPNAQIRTLVTPGDTGSGAPVSAEAGAGSLTTFQWIPNVTGTIRINYISWGK